MKGKIMKRFICLAVCVLSHLSLNAISQYTELEIAKEPSQSNVHGFFDIAFKNAYMTPRGLLNTNNGLTTQVIAGLGVDVYKNNDTFINKATLYGFIWNDLWSKQHNHHVGSWNECDWGAGMKCTLLQDWTFGAQYLEFLSPPHNFKAEKNIEFLLAYDDTNWGLPVVFNPYAKCFWAVSGDSTVVVGKRGGTYDVELGLIPTLDYRKTDFPVLVTIPTWVTVGPHKFWNGGVDGLKHKKTNAGVFSTGLQLEFPVSVIPASYGSWYVRTGLQYYHIINDNLIHAQRFTLNGRSTHRNVYVASVGIGFTF